MLSRVGCFSLYWNVCLVTFCTNRVTLFIDLASLKVGWTVTSCNTVVTNMKPLLCTAGSDVLRALYSELTTQLDARVVAASMYQRNALTLRELQSIQSLRDRPVEAAETLLNIIKKQPDAVYLCFLDVLKHTEQQHIYQTLVQDGYTGILLSA